MYKFLIVDDEPMIREGLKSLIEWEDYGFEVVDTAADGKDALTKYEACDLDLMIVDIRMPRMDGLQVIEEIRKTDSSLHFLILSGYADFEYAKKSLSMRVDGYILKPVDEDELIRFIEQLKNRLDQEQDIRRLLVEDEVWRRNKLLHSLISGKAAEYPEEIDDWTERSGLTAGVYQILALEWPDTIQHHAGTEHPVKEAAKEELLAMFDRTRRGVVFSQEPYIGILLNEDIHERHKLKGWHKELSNRLSQDGCSFYAAAGTAVNHISEIHKSWESALDLLKHKFFYEEHQILSPLSDIYLNLDEELDVGERHAEEQAVDLAEQANKLCYALEVGNQETVSRIVTVAARYFVTQDRSEQAVKTGLIQLLSAALNKLTYTNPAIQANVQAISESFKAVYGQNNMKSLLRMIHGLLETVAVELECNSKDKPAQKMVDLIQLNYCENLKLETLAEVFNYSSAHLGKLFKSYTGEYFNTYLDKVRISHAKELLLQGLKVYQVSERVGYTNVDYFHSKFKKYVGISPATYRKEQSKRQS